MVSGGHGKNKDIVVLEGGRISLLKMSLGNDYVESYGMSDKVKGSTNWRLGKASFRGKLIPISRIFIPVARGAYSITPTVLVKKQKTLIRSKEYQIQTHHLFIDFKNAYDSVNRTLLYSA